MPPKLLGLLLITNMQSQQRRCSMKKDVIRNFTKINRKTPAPQSTLLKRGSGTGVFRNFLRTTFYRTPLDGFWILIVWTGFSWTSILNSKAQRMITVQWKLFRCRSTHQRCSIKKGVLRSFTKMNRKTPVPESTLLKQRLWHRCFTVYFAKLLRPFFFFFQNICGRLFL